MSDPITRLNAALEGRYRIERELGEGGMATVYLARDLKHNRNVALKVLKPELGAVVGADRFLAEIETTANLQHPHILPLHDSGEADGFLFYVMPYVEGESLRERLDREQQLPVNEAVQIATNVAEALDYAHAHGVIHRDIKPANILLQAGKSVISDFGIALALSAGGAGRLTETGLSLGTPHYMSPEQATGDVHVGPATDIYALGCVLCEMLVGEPPYTGRTPQAVLGKIITGEPVSAAKHRPSIPANVDATIRKALEKLPADRFASGADFATALGDPRFEHGESVTGEATKADRRWKGVAVATGVLSLLTSSLAIWALARPAEEISPPVARFESPFIAGQEPRYSDVTGFAMSPDGSFMVYWGPDERLWIRRWDDPEATPLPYAEGRYVDVSHDGRQVAFLDAGSVITVASIEGGPPRPLVQSSSLSPPRWGPRDEYVYYRGAEGGTWRIPSAGGGPVPVTRVAEGEISHAISDFLPGGDNALLWVRIPERPAEIRVLDIATGDMKSIGSSAATVRYAESGHLLFRRTVNSVETLMAAPFDARSLEVTGAAVPLIEGVRHYSVSDRGHLVYTTEDSAATTELVWVTRSGTATPVDPGWSFRVGDTGLTGEYGWRLSPSGEQIVYDAIADGNREIFIRDLPSGLSRRLTVTPTSERLPWWAPDGSRVNYVSGPPASRHVWSIHADGTGQPTLLMDSPSFGQGISSRSGEWMVLRTRSPSGLPGARDVVAFRPGVDSDVVPILGSPDYGERSPALSPDGRWLAYVSEQTGRSEVLVSSFPDVRGGTWPISSRGGISPVWGPMGHEVFFVTAGRTLMVATVETDPVFELVALDSLFTIPDNFHASPGADFYDVTGDHQRFLMGRSAGATYHLVLNFYEELKRLVPN